MRTSVVTVYLSYFDYTNDMDRRRDGRTACVLKEAEHTYAHLLCTHFYMTCECCLIETGSTKCNC